jgi:uncharacterized protein (TIGR00369 family)
MTLIDEIRAARAAGDVGRFLDAIPYARYIGIAATVEGGVLTARLTQSPHIIGNPMLPAIHGGVIGALLETTAILQLLWSTESAALPKTITITIDYLRSAGAQDTFARADVTKLGARVANVRAVAWQGDQSKPVAGANANFLLAAAT